MATSAEEIEEVKILANTHLASIVWPTRTPKENSSYLQEFSNHIRNKFNEPSPDRFAQELNIFTNLRNIASSVIRGHSPRDIDGLQALKRYYCQLSVMLSRFRDCDAKFSWKDSYGRGSNEGNIEFEINNIMYNIAAIENQIGSETPKSDSATRQACLHFSSALWFVTELRDNRTGLKPRELGHDLLSFFHHVLKGQAQECVLSHSIKSGMRPDNVAKIAIQISSDYDIAHKMAQNPLYKDPLREILNGASVFFNWRTTVEFKYKYFLAMAHLLSGLSNRDDDAKEIAIRIARLRLVVPLIESCKKLQYDTMEGDKSSKAVEALETLTKRKLEKAIRYNDNVYHSSIPGGETLPQIAGKGVVAPLPFSCSSIPDFKDIFSDLVTIEAIQVSSIYSKNKDDLSRDITAQVSKQDEELAQMMSTLSFDRRSLRLNSIEAPDELIEICAELSMNPGVVDEVLTKLEELDDKAEEIQKMLDRVDEMLKRQPNREFEEELKRYKSTQEEALKTTHSLHKQLHPELQQKIQLMATTDDPLELLPKVNSTSANDEDIIRKLEKLLDKVDEMKQQRTSLLAQLKQSLNQDDVIEHVVAASSEQELKDVFDKEFRKHNKYLQPLQSNLKLQNEMLDALEKVNAQYGQVKLNHRAQKAAYNERVESLTRFYNQFKATSAGIEEGLKYHTKMTDLIRKFCAKVQATHDMNDLLN